jgi:peroxiredoxin
MRIRWAIAAVAVVALAAVAVNYYMPWRTRSGSGPSGRSASAKPVSCPVDAKPANLNFTLKDVAGKEVALSEYKGKVILLDFWATWCAPCKVEIPGFVDFQNRYGKDGLQVVGISVDDTVEQLTPFIKEYKMNYPVLQGLGRDEVAQAFGAVVALPHTVMISRDGKICAQLTGLTGHDVFESHIKGLL